VARRHILPATWLAGVLVVVVGCVGRAPDEPPGTEPTELLQPQPPSKIPRNLGHGAAFGAATGSYTGVVAAVGPDWVELKAGWTLWLMGKQEPTKEQQDNTKQRRISAAGTRPAGDPEGPDVLETHLLTDLQIGDRVEVFAAILKDGREWATEIHIIRRPGGKIPPMQTDGPFADKRPSTKHLEYQAYQDWEEKGIRIPRKHLGADGRVPWTNPPYPPVAPQPRPVAVRP
jgi:hypothetical protein